MSNDSTVDSNILLSFEKQPPSHRRFRPIIEAEGRKDTFEVKVKITDPLRRNGRLKVELVSANVSKNHPCVHHLHPHRLYLIKQNYKRVKSKKPSRKKGEKAKKDRRNRNKKISDARKELMQNVEQSGVLEINYSFDQTDCVETTNVNLTFNLRIIHAGINNHEENAEYLKTCLEKFNPFGNSLEAIENEVNFDKFRIFCQAFVSDDDRMTTTSEIIMSNVINQQSSGSTTNQAASNDCESQNDADTMEDVEEVANEEGLERREHGDENEDAGQAICIEQIFDNPNEDQRNTIDPQIQNVIESHSNVLAHVENENDTEQPAGVNNCFKRKVSNSFNEINNLFLKPAKQISLSSKTTTNSNSQPLIAQTVNNQNVNNISQSNHDNNVLPLNRIQSKQNENPNTGRKNDQIGDDILGKLMESHNIPSDIDKWLNLNAANEKEDEIDDDIQAFIEKNQIDLTQEVYYNSEDYIEDIPNQINK